MCLLVKKVVVLFFINILVQVVQITRTRSFFYFFISKRIFIFFIPVLIRKLLDSYI